MTQVMQKRTRVYKQFLKRRIKSLKGIAYKVKLARFTARELGKSVGEWAPGISFSNVARDVRRLVGPGEDYDAEFDLLWRGQALPAVIESYSEDFLAGLVKNIIAPTDLDRALAEKLQPRFRPDGRRLWEA